MKLSKKRTILISICLVIIIITAITVFAETGLIDFTTNTNSKIANDLAVLSGLPIETVLRLYDSIGSWDSVRQNIFLYKKMLRLVPLNSDDYDNLFVLARQYKADDMLTVYEYVYRHSNNFSLAGKMLEKHTGGTDMESVLAEVESNKPYKIYKPAGQDLVRRWLNQGYKPQDIISADEIARARDLDIAAVLALKDENNSWQVIGTKLGYTFKQEQDRPVTINVRGVTGNPSFIGKDYESVVREANQKAGEQEAALELKVIQESRLTAEQVKSYKEQGFNLRDIQNASRLAESSGTTMEKILQERRDGKDWKEIISAYSG